MLIKITMSNNNNVSGHQNNSNMGDRDTTLTKVFVGGLAWETPKESMRDHFEKYGEILEAVIISDKVTGRSKGYGFVTFKEAESAKKACEDASPIINGRRANCNLASLGARRSKPPPSITPPPQQGPNVVGPRANSASPASHVQWYYPAMAPQAAAPPASPFHHRHLHQPVPFYGYSPAYIARDMNYNHKLNYTGGPYMNGHFSQVYPGQPMMGANSLMPMYPYYHFHHQSQSLGLPAHIYSPIAAGPITSVPALITKTTTVPPTAVCLAVE